MATKTTVYTDTSGDTQTLTTVQNPAAHLVLGRERLEALVYVTHARHLRASGASRPRARWRTAGTATASPIAL